MEIKLLPLSAVDVGERLRAVNAEAVERLAISMREMGQMTPIEVVETEGGRFRLVAGAHRLAACEVAGIEQVKAILLDWEMSEIDIALREVDENLYRQELTAYDQAVFIAKRAELWEQKYEVRRGRPKNVQARTFYKDTAEKFGLSADAIKRARMRFHKLGLVWADLRGTPIADVGNWLDKLRGLDADKQRQVINLVRGGLPFPSAYAKARGERTVKPIRPHAECARLVSLWENTSEEGRELFRKHIRGSKKRGAAEEG
jgi:ParB family chromosome partitioning protein